LKRAAFDFVCLGGTFLNWLSSDVWTGSSSLNNKV
jgi:hypothetical protein